MDQSLSLATASASASSHTKPLIVGLYGIPGSGKSHLLNELRAEMSQDEFTFFEGSGVIASLVTGGLDKFKALSERDKTEVRERAIGTIARQCEESGKVGLVAGHFMFWAQKVDDQQTVCTASDLKTYTHIIYLDTPADVVAERCYADTTRDRPSMPIPNLVAWQAAEKEQLQSLCREQGILFVSISEQPPHLAKMSTLLRDFRQQNEQFNLSLALDELDVIATALNGRLDTMIVLDADGTLAAEDTGKMFWEKVANSSEVKGDRDTLKTLFGSGLGHSYTAFRQAVLLYEQTADSGQFDRLCAEVAREVSVRSEFLSMLRQVEGLEHARAVVITSGLRRVWEKVLEREGLSESVRVIGGGRIENGLVVNAEVKRALVARLRDHHQLFVWAFGDGPLDLPMLEEADRGVVVVGKVETRSKSMEAALKQTIREDGARLRQLLFPSDAPPRLNLKELPLFDFQDQDFAISILQARNQQQSLQVLHENDSPAVKLLQTPMRDAAVSGPALRDAHRRAGRFLATWFVTSLIGQETYPIKHVQGKDISGYRLHGEDKTSIIALMRGGEPMASGVSDTFPLAMFIHANDPQDIKSYHLDGQKTIILVDSVINSGKTVLEFVRYVRKMSATIRIVVVAGVVQDGFIAGNSVTHRVARHSGFSLVTLRISTTKFTGSGGTDTGNRLFNTTHLP